MLCGAKDDLLEGSELSQQDVIVITAGRRVIRYLITATSIIVYLLQQTVASIWLVRTR